MRLLLCFLALGVLVTGCDGVRRIKSPSNDISVTIVRKVGPLPDDCEVREVEGHCEVSVGRHPRSGSSLLGTTFRRPAQVINVSCRDAPVPELRVATIQRCMWPGTQEELRRAVCRAGGDTIVHEISATDSCIQEGLEDDAVSGTSIGIYAVYRMRH
ncbi:MAG: hypothetical protein HY898_14315 [Deltaproteobacteria bacterium]|nr:hypothetical protein [Deltaproteobacteria bacterium]